MNMFIISTDCGAPMLSTLKPPFRADHVGSLRRPDQLMQARERLLGAHDLDRNFGPHANAELRAIEDECIRDVVRLQEDAGLRSITDGEFRRAQWHMDFIYQLGGIGTIDDETFHVRFRNEQGVIEWTPPLLHVEERLHLDHTIFGDAFEFLKSCASAEQTPKLTIPSPSMVHYRGGRASIDESVYPDMDSFWADLVAAYREEVRRLAALGVRAVITNHPAVALAALATD